MQHPESAKMGLTWVGNVGCKREGRRFVGQYVMTQNDVMKVDRLCTRKAPWCVAPAFQHAHPRADATLTLTSNVTRTCKPEHTRAHQH